MPQESQKISQLFQAAEDYCKTNDDPDCAPLTTPMQALQEACKESTSEQCSVLTATGTTLATTATDLPVSTSWIDNRGWFNWYEKRCSSWWYMAYNMAYTASHQYISKNQKAVLAKLNQYAGHEAIKMYLHMAKLQKYTPHVDNFFNVMTLIYHSQQFTQMTNLISVLFRLDAYINILVSCTMLAGKLGLTLGEPEGPHSAAYHYLFEWPLMLPILKYLPYYFLLPRSLACSKNSFQAMMTLFNAFQNNANLLQTLGLNLSPFISTTAEPEKTDKAAETFMSLRILGTAAPWGSHWLFGSREENHSFNQHLKQCLESITSPTKEQKTHYHNLLFNAYFQWGSRGEATQKLLRIHWKTFHPDQELLDVRCDGLSLHLIIQAAEDIYHQEIQGQFVRNVKLKEQLINDQQGYVIPLAHQKKELLVLNGHCYTASSAGAIFCGAQTGKTITDPGLQQNLKTLWRETLSWTPATEIIKQHLGATIAIDDNHIYLKENDQTQCYEIKDTMLQRRPQQAPDKSPFTPLDNFVAQNHPLAAQLRPLINGPAARIIEEAAWTNSFWRQFSLYRYDPTPLLDKHFPAYFEALAQNESIKKVPNEAFDSITGLLTQRLHHPDNANALISLTKQAVTWLNHLEKGEQKTDDFANTLINLLESHVVEFQQANKEDMVYTELERLENNTIAKTIGDALEAASIAEAFKRT